MSGECAYVYTSIHQPTHLILIPWHARVPNRHGRSQYDWLNDVDGDDERRRTKTTAVTTFSAVSYCLTAALSQKSSTWTMELGTHGQDTRTHRHPYTHIYTKRNSPWWYYLFRLRRFIVHTIVIKIQIKEIYLTQMCLIHFLRQPTFVSRLTETSSSQSSSSSSPNTEYLGDQIDTLRCIQFGAFYVALIVWMVINFGDNFGEAWRASDDTTNIYGLAQDKRKSESSEHKKLM